MMIEITLLWIIQRLIAGLLYFMVIANIVSAVILTGLGSFTFFHVLPSILLTIGLVKLAQYPFKGIEYVHA